VVATNRPRESPLVPLDDPPAGPEPPNRQGP